MLWSSSDISFEIIIIELLSIKLVSVLECVKDLLRIQVVIFRDSVIILFCLSGYYTLLSIFNLA